MSFSLRNLLIATAVGPVIFFVVAYLLSPATSKGYFSPDSLEFRTQSDLRFFGTDVSWFRSPYKYHNQRLVDFLISKGYWKPSESTSARRWIFLFHSSEMWRDGENWLHRSLFWKSDFWIEWSIKHPDTAAQFWPNILELLRSGDETPAVELLLAYAEPEVVSSVNDMREPQPPYERQQDAAAMACGPRVLSRPRLLRRRAAA